MTDGHKKKARPTIQAIAERAGVSRATVSLILTNRPEVVSRFKPATVEKVRSLAEEMGYTANLMAISLRSPHPTFFGLILRGRGVVDAHSWHHQALEGQFVSGVMEAARLRKLFCVLATQQSPDAEAAAQRVRGLIDGGVFGAIVRTPVPELDEPMRRQIEQGLPVVIVFPEHPTACSSNAIDVDNPGVGRIAGQLLRDAGRRRWLIISDDFLWEPIRLREQGALAAATEAGVNVELLTIPSDIGEAGIVAWLTPRLKDLRPDGIYAASSVASVGTLHSCLEAGLRVPDDTCLVGCDASFWRVPGWSAITSVDVSWYEAGDLAVRKMVELQESEQAVFDNVQLSPRVRAGDTCPVSAAT